MTGKFYLTKFIYFLSIIAFSPHLHGQNPEFRQQVDYTINVNLDDKQHSISGNATVTYYNNSVDTLRELYVHFWANAFNDKSSSMAREAYDKVVPPILTCKESETAGYKYYYFISNGDTLQYTEYQGNSDVVKVHLNQPILPGTITTLDIPFKLILPQYLVGIQLMPKNGFRIANWYPKIVVYDQDGWHPMPNYLNGTIYGDYGDYNVNITLPRNYTVAATGELTTVSEIQRLDSMPYNLMYKQRKEKLIPSASEMKTLNFVAYNVNDFFWYPDKAFQVVRKTIVKDGKSVKLFIYLLPGVRLQGDEVVAFIEESFDQIGQFLYKYPYPQFTLISDTEISLDSRGFPMVSLISESGTLDDWRRSIVKGICDNYFNSILGINHKQFPWFAEGLSAYYLNRFYTIKDNKNRKSKTDYVPPLSADLFYDLVHNYQQPIALPAVNNPFQRYSPGEHFAAELAMLEGQMGTDTFLTKMYRFLGKRKYQHLKPQDFETEFNVRHKMDWLFKDQLYTKHTIDYALDQVSVRGDSLKLCISNRSNVSSPVLIEQIRKDSVFAKQWIDGFIGKKEISIPNLQSDKVFINSYIGSLDMNYRNNKRLINGRKYNPIKSKIFSSYNLQRDRALYFLPYIGYNIYNKFQVGIAFHNLDKYTGRFSYILAPAIGFKSGRLIGNGTIQYFLPIADSLDTHLVMGIHAKSYDYYSSEKYNYTNRYMKINPYVDFVLPQSDTRQITNTFSLSSNFIRFFDHSLTFDTSGLVILGLNNETNNRIVSEIGFEHEKRTALSYFKVKSRIQHFNFTYFNNQKRDRIRWLNELLYEAKYDCQHSISLRLFAGTMLYNSHATDDDAAFTNYQPGVLSLFNNGVIDNMTTFDGNFFGRSEQSGLSSAQIINDETNGGFKGAFSSSLTSGISNHYIASANIKVDLPVQFPILAYLDLGYGDIAIAGPKSTRFLWEFGTMINFKNVLEIYIPIVYHEELKYLYSQTRSGKFLGRISFSIPMQNFNLRFFSVSKHNRINLVSMY
jgi:hypothetical protein